MSRVPAGVRASLRQRGKLHQLRRGLGEQHFDDAVGLVRLGRDFEFSFVSLDNFAADGKAESESDGAGGEEWGGTFAGSFGGEAGTVVMHFYFGEAAAFAIEPLIALESDGDAGIGGIGLECIKKDFDEGVLDGGAVASDDG